MKQLGFTVTNALFGDVSRPVAQFSCVECYCTVEIPLLGKMNPEMNAKAAVRKGWQAEAYRRSRTYCPQCLGPAKTNDVDSELKKVIPPMPSAIPIADAPIIHLSRPVQHVVPAPAPEHTPPGKEIALTAPKPRNVPNPKIKVRALLDIHFDDSLGMYLDGYDDARVAEESEVAVADVASLRESAYGPIRITAEIKALLTQYGALKEALDVQRGVLDAMEGKLRKLGEDLKTLMAG